MTGKFYNVYIDESGDEGLNKGSKYFILTALIVAKEKDLEISKNVDFIKNNLGLSIKKQLHWNSIKGFKNKKMIMNVINNIDVIIINIIIDTGKIKYLVSKNLYLFFSGYLYERICWLMNDLNGKANIIISSRGNLSKENLINFLNNKNHQKFNIDINKINSVRIIPNERLKLLQLADSCASALFQALKYLDNVHFEYINIVKNKIYHKKNNLLSYGLKIVPINNYNNDINKLIKYLIKK